MRIELCPEGEPRTLGLGGFLVVTSLVGLMAAGTSSRASETDKTDTPRPAGTVTYNKDIAPIIYRRCAVCHHDGQNAPFSLFTFEQVRRHAQQIAEVTHSRFMPPWLPQPGYGKFVGERRLTEEEIGLIQQWVREGAREGRGQDLPRAPRWVDGWQLGRPDLILKMPAPYRVPADGRDVYRNFVIRVPIDTMKYVRGVELNPGNFRVVHHAFVKVDPSARSRHLDEADSEPGFPGMDTPAEMPGGQFLTWQPGKQPSMSPKGLAWRLDPGDDLVLEMHLRPTGKEETLQASVALYFTEEAPTNTCFKFSLCSLKIDVPPGVRDYEVNDSYVLPVDVDLLGILPHAHYLCKEMQGYARLPSGRRKWLLWIKQWDFNWQGDYRYAEPIHLPKGTALFMRYTYDNSADNPRNPNSPPKRVRYGPQSSDEMGELWFQVLTHNTNDFDLLAADYNNKLAQNVLASEEYAVQVNPKDAQAHLQLGIVLYGLGRASAAKSQFESAIQIEPDLDQPYFYLGLMLRLKGQLRPARDEFEAALRFNPQNFDAYGNLGLICAAEGDIAGAEADFRSALKINPDDPKAQACLKELLEIKAARAKTR